MEDCLTTDCEQEVGEESEHSAKSSLAYRKEGMIYSQHSLLFAMPIAIVAHRRVGVGVDIM